MSAFELIDSLIRSIELPRPSTAVIVIPNFVYLIYTAVTVIVLGCMLLTQSLLFLVALDAILVHLYFFCTSTLAKFYTYIYRTVVDPRNEEESTEIVESVSIAAAKIVIALTWSCHVFGVPPEMLQENAMSIFIVSMIQTATEVLSNNHRSRWDLRRTQIVRVTVSAQSIISFLLVCMVIAAASILNQSQLTYVIDIAILHAHVNHLDSFFLGLRALVVNDFSCNEQPVDSKKAMFSLELSRNLARFALDAWLVLNRPAKLLYVFPLMVHDCICVYVSVMCLCVYTSFEKQIMRHYSRLSSAEAEALTTAGDLCPVCLCGHTQDSCRLPCGHAVHVPCVRRLLASTHGRRCPVCRRSTHTTSPPIEERREGDIAHDSVDRQAAVPVSAEATRRVAMLLRDTNNINATAPADLRRSGREPLLQRAAVLLPRVTLQAMNFNRISPPTPRAQTVAVGSRSSPSTPSTPSTTLAASGLIYALSGFAASSARQAAVLMPQQQHHHHHQQQQHLVTTTSTSYSETEMQTENEVSQQQQQYHVDASFAAAEVDREEMRVVSQDAPLTLDAPVMEKDGNDMSDLNNAMPTADSALRQDVRSVPLKKRRYKRQRSDISDPNATALGHTNNNCDSSFVIESSMVTQRPTRLRKRRKSN